MASQKKIYLDYNATTPVDLGVVDAMLPYFTEKFGNASSDHVFGWDAGEAVENARKQIAGLESLEFDTKILVLGAKEDEINKKINSRSFEVVINENWEEGMSTSIRKGLSEALNLEKELEHILIMLSDQPLVTKDKIEELIRVHLDSQKQATFSEYAGDVGVPAIFSREIFSDLKKLQGDQGAKKLIYDTDFQFGTVQFENGNFDVNTIEDVELLKRMEEE